MTSGAARCEAMLLKQDWPGRPTQCSRSAATTLRYKAWCSDLEIRVCGLHRRVIERQLAAKAGANPANRYDSRNGNTSQRQLWEQP
jgi:hypothetical protein